MNKDKFNHERTARRDVLINKVMMHLVIFTGLLFAIVMYIVFVPIEILYPNVQPYKVLTPVVERGGTLIYEVDACKLRSAVGFVTRTFVINNIEYKLISEKGQIRKGCNKMHVRVHVPDTLPVGEAYLAIDIAYELNPLRTIYYNLRTDRFIIESGVE